MEAFFDNDGETDEPIPIRVKVIVAGDEMTIDYSDMADRWAASIPATTAADARRRGSHSSIWSRTTSRRTKALFGP